MQLLKDRIKKDGVVKQGNVLKVDQFLNHQLDLKLLREMAKELKKRFEGEEITKVVTVESSGIGFACMVADELGLPLVFAKKSKTKNINGEVYISRVESFDHGRVYDLIISKQVLCAEDKILLIDDILANGKALEGLVNIVEDSGANLVGAGVAIEKGFQIGGTSLREQGIRVEALVTIDRMDWRSGRIEFRSEQN